MNALELLLLGSLIVVISAIQIHARMHRDPTWFWNPLTLFSAIFAYYFVIGPLITLMMGQTTFYGTNLRESMWKSWLAGLLGLSSLCAGFLVFKPRVTTLYTRGFDKHLRLKTWRACAVLFALGLVGFAYDAIYSGQPLVNLLIPFHSSTAEVEATEKEGVAVGNYIFLLINSFIPAMCLLVLLMKRHKFWVRVAVILPIMLQIILFYSSLGFRHRIILLILSTSATWYLSEGKRPAQWRLVLGVVGILFMAGAIVLTRSYGRGLDLGQLSSLSLFELFLGGFNDAGTFYTTALVINSFPSAIPFVGLDPLWIALTIPVPRSLWPDKPYAAFLDHFEFLMGTRGQAVPNVGEYYMMAGWTGVVIGSFIVGALYKFFWTFYRRNPGNPIVLAMYAVSFALIFPLVNRGYLAQTCMEFFFDLLPLVILFLAVRKSMLPRRSSAALSRSALS